MYVFSDAYTHTEEYEENGEIKTRVIKTPGIKIGDGQAYVIDLPFSTVSPEQIEF